METVIFTKEIFDLLINCGFRYCYSKTEIDKGDKDEVRIVLTPVKLRPDIRKLPIGYDTCFNLEEGPEKLSFGICRDTIVHVNLSETLLKECYE